MDRVFSKALLIQPPRCLDRQLLPLTIGHAALLDVLESPFLNDAAPSLGDLVTAVYVCSLPFPEAKDRIQQRGRVTRECRAWGRSVGPRFNFEREARKFQGYVHDYVEGPDLFLSEPIKDRTPAAWTWGLVQCLMHFYGFDQNKAWNTVVCEAACLLAYASEMKGVGEIKTDADLRGERILQAMEKHLKTSQPVKT